MIDIEDAPDFFDKAIELVIGTAMNKAALEASLDGLGLIKTRVINKGEDHKGGKFKAYSDKPLPKFFFTGRSKPGSDVAERKIEKGKGFPASYKDWREANNLQTKFKDFKFTGRMWTSIVPKVIRQEPTKTTVEINATSEEERKKVQWMTEQQGNFLLPNPAELKEMGETYKDILVESLEGIFNS